MKKRLLKPPANDGEIFFSPPIETFLSHLRRESRIGVCHQPYFFNPGVSVKFIFLNNLSFKSKEVIFLDTDQIDLGAKVPCREGSVKRIGLIRTDDLLYNYLTPKEDVFRRFFSSLEDELKMNPSSQTQNSLENLLLFKDIIFRNIDKKFLKEVLAEGLIQYYSMGRDYTFLSDIIHSNEFKDFFLKIHKDDTAFRKVFNEALDGYREEYRFRYKNFPFPRLEENELPFWVIRDGKRFRCFKQDIDKANFDSLTVFPRAATLTIFLRLYELDFFIHGIGGANYEWVQDRIIERFFKKAPPPFAIVSATFLIDGVKERSLPYFLFSPQRIIDSVYTLC